jgi:membrane protease YdiL (CAAX protease family)
MIKVRDRSPLRFFILALALSWVFWLPAALSGQDVMAFPWMLLLIAGGVGPAIAEVILIARSHDRAGWQDYWQRVLDFRRISAGWWAVILLTFPILNGIAISLNLLLTGERPDFETAARLLSQPWMILPFAVFILLFGPLPEELGWRGYGLDSLQARWNALTSSLILGAMWALWHLPLFFMAGTFQHDEVGFGTPGFWSFCLGTTISSILFTWIYNNTNRSTLSAILFHFSINFSGEFLTPTEQARLYQLLLTGLMAVAVTLIWGPQTLTRRWESREGNLVTGRAER